MPWKKNQPGCACCTTVLTCTNCFGNSAANQYQVDLSGIVASTCSGSSSINGTWVLSNISPCNYKYTLTDAEASGLQNNVSRGVPSCSGGCVGYGFGDLVDVILNVGKDGLGYFIKVTVTISIPQFAPCWSSANYIFYKNYGATAPACTSLSLESIAFSTQNGGYGYDASAGSCLVSSL